MKQFHDKVAVITGAGSGIGCSLALRLASLGCHVALADIDGHSIKHVAQKIKAQGVECSTQVVDVANWEQVQAFAAHCLDRHRHVHLLFNNAGVSLVDYAESQTHEDVSWVMNTNFWGVVHGCKAFLPLLRQVDEAHIVNMSSLFGLAAAPSQSAYNASKFAVRGYTEALKMELAQTHIGVSCVHPGGIRTNIVKASRIREDHVNIRRSRFEKRFDKLARTTADNAAHVIVDGVRKNRRRILVGLDARLIDKMIRLFPAHYERLLGLERPLAERIR